MLLLRDYFIAQCPDCQGYSPMQAGDWEKEKGKRWKGGRLELSENRRGKGGHWKDGGKERGRSGEGCYFLCAR